MDWSKPIALDPRTGGACIDVAALQPADIIVSTTKSGLSGVIRIGTMSVVSHAALYMGDGQLLEAIGSGVSKTAIGSTLEHNALAVVYRHPNMTPALASAILKDAADQVGKPYARYGAAGAGAPTSLAQMIYCSTSGSDTTSFFCSQYVAEAFRQADCLCRTRRQDASLPAAWPAWRPIASSTSAT